MKRIIAVAALVLALSSVAFAQENTPAPSQTKGWEINAGIGGVNIFNALFLYTIPILSHTAGSSSAYSADGHDSWNKATIPPICFDARYRVNRTFSFGVDVQTQYMGAPQYKTNSETNEKEYRGYHSLAVLSVMPTVRINYVSKPKFTMYGELQAGACYYAWDCNGRQINWSGQLIPVGMTFGRKVFGFVEAGIGTQWVGGMAGIGYRF